MKWNRSLPSGTKDKLFREANGAYQLEKQVNDIVKKEAINESIHPLSSLKMYFIVKKKMKKNFTAFSTNKADYLY